MLTKRKAKKILREGTAHGQPLTEKQEHYMQAIAHGWKPSRLNPGETDKVMKRVKK